MPADFGRHIDHTLLRPAATTTDVGRLCREACDYGMAAVCVFPSHVALARKMLRETSVKVATVIAFPFGATVTDVKAAEMKAVASSGAHELDIVINISCVKSGDNASVEAEMEELTRLARSLSMITKFIMETGYLTDEEKVRVCTIANRVRPDFMKTSTGYGPSGANVEDVALMRRSLLGEIQIKAAGGIRSFGQALTLIQAGASRIGTSSGISIVEESRKL
jgi:deoxyribose-phosphate aldolase